MATWFETIRGECSRNLWSRGVELARAEAVTRERVDEDEAVLRVTNPDGMLTPTVTLYLDEGAWDCDCPSPEDPCEHVAAAAIALNKAKRAGVALPTAGTGGRGGHVRYCFFREHGWLLFERHIVQGESETRVEESLKSIASGRKDGPAFLASESDLRVEVALAASSLLVGRGKVTRIAANRLFPALAGCEDVRLDGQPISVDIEPIGPRGRVEDDGDGFRVTVAPDPSITESFRDRLVLCGDVLRPLLENALTGRELEDLPNGLHFRPGRAVELATEILPDLQRRIPVDVLTERLPKPGKAEPPRPLVQTRREGDGLAVRVDLVYGDPPAARVVDGRLEHVQGPVPIRDEAAERRLARLVQERLELPVGEELQVRDAEALAVAERLAGWQGGIEGDAQERFHRAPPLAPRLDLSAGSFDVAFETPGEAPAGAPGGGRVDGAAVLRAWEAGDAFVPLVEGGLAPLPTDWLARFGRAAQSLLEARREDGSLPGAALPDLARLCDEVGEPPPPELGRIEALLEDFEGLPAAALPDGLAKVLRGYQRQGVDWLCFLREAGLGGLLADDMGLGKTLQMLCAVRGRTLVVAPTSVLHSWQEEVRRFRPELSVCVYHGPRRALDPDADLTLTTYAILRLDAEALAARTWDVAVLDEAQAIKNPDSQVARAAHALDARWRVTLTGTPVENRLDELWSQIQFGNPGLLGSRRRFQERYARPIADGVPGVAEELRARIRPFVLRRLKREVAPELPPRTERVLHCTLREEERAVYDAVRAATRADVVAKLQQGGSVLAALEALLRLRQAASHRGLVPGQEAAGSSKVDLLLEELDEAVAEGHKALVFSQWTGLLDRVEPHLDAAAIPYTRLDGSTRDRGAVVDRFQADDGPLVMLISLRAGGTGLTLTAADHVFLLDPWWNPAVEDQAADRAHRIGQTKPVMVHRLVAEETVEERILALQARKRSLADAALGDAAAAAELTRDDLLALLE